LKKRPSLLRALEKRVMLDASLPAVAGQVLWLDADDTATVLDAEGDNAASGAFSGSVSTWQDKSGSGFHVTATAGQAPVYNATGLNGNGVLTFDGVNDKLTRATAAIAGDDLTMFIVFNKTTPGTNRDAIFEAGSGSARNAVFVGDSANKIGYYVNSVFYNYSTNYTAGNYELSSVVHNTAAISLFDNAAPVGTPTGLTRIATNGLFVGDDSSGGDNLQGSIAEIILYDRDLTADERHDVETYLASKWGLSITNAAPSVSTNTGATLNEGATATITAAMLAAADTDNTDPSLTYTVTSASGHGTLFRDADSDGVIDAGEALSAGGKFTQADIAAGYLRYQHDGTDTIADSFSFTVSDQLSVTAATTFNLTINPVLDLPVTSGAVLWLDGGDAATILDADGDAADSGSFDNGVQTWVNKATPGTHNAVQTTLADRPDYTAGGINGLGSVAFDSANTEFLGLGSFAALTAGDVFIVLKAVQDQPSSSQNTGFMGFGTNGQNTHYAWTDGAVYDDFGSTMRYNIGNLAQPLDQANLYNASSEAGSWIARQNGIVQYTSGTNTVAFTNTAYLGMSDSTSYTFNGQVAEIILYDHVLNAADRLAVENYLNAKWFSNTSPAISAVTDQSISEDGNTGAIAFTVGDNETAAGSLTVTATSSDTGLISNGAILIGGSGANRTITLTPTANASGTATITITVDDGSGGLTTETFDVTVAAVNDAPAIAANTGGSVNEGGSLTITTAMLNEGDIDDSGAGLTYTASSLVNGHIEVNGATQAAFTQADIDNGLVRFVHNGSETTAASFAFSLADGGEDGAVPATGTFNIAVTPVNDAPVIQGWTLVSSEDFEGGTTDWALNTTTAGGTLFSRYLGPFSNDGGVQSNSRTYTLSGTQGYTVIEFDFYRMDTWDNEAFRIFINDSQVFTQNFSTGITTVADGASGIASWTVTERSTLAGNAGNASANDQIFRFTMTIQNSAASTVKIGFGSTTNQATNDESWGVDNVKVYEANSGGTPGPFGIAENSANGSVVGRITATDAESNAITYSITGGTGASAFAINASTGAITVLNSTLLNYESTASYTLQITATDNGSPNSSDVETITINVLDIPENTAPVVGAAGPFSVAENAANNTVIGTVSATDAEGNTISWSITGGNTDNIFAINSAGQIRVNSNANLNYEWDNQYVLTIAATDNGFGLLAGTRNITIDITNINEAPTFDTYTALLAADPYLRYNATTGNFYKVVSTAATYAAASTAAAGQALYGVAGHLVTVTSAAENTYIRGLSAVQMWLGGSDTTTEGTWLWAGTGPEGGATFWLGAGSGAGGSAQNGYYTNWSGTANPDNSGGGVGEDFMVMLTGAGQWNDIVGTGTNAYVIEWEGADVQATLTALQNGPYTIAENTASGASVGFVESFDIDASDTRTYSVTGGTGTGMFAVNAATGEITLTASPNYEAATSYTLDVRVTDAAGLFATRTVTVNITNVNETPVLATAGPFAFNENVAAGTSVVTMAGSDVDAGQTLAYSLQSGNTGGMFAINASTGAITFAGSPNFEALGSYNLVVRVTDNGTGSLYAERTVAISINDLNEAPSFSAVQHVLDSDPTLRYNATTGNFYRYVSSAAVYGTASAAAAAAQVDGTSGHLVTITSAVENNFVRSMMGSNIWLAASDMAVEGEWRWTEGPEAGQLFWLGTGGGSAQNGFYTNWGGGEPNDFGSGEDRAQFRTDNTWNDTANGDSLAYVIEWEGAAVLAGYANGPYTVAENSAAGASAGTPQAFDPDAGDAIAYSITGGTGAGLFAIDAATGALTVTGALDYEAAASYTLPLRAQDNAGLFDTTTVTINIADINEAPTALALSHASVDENSANGTVIGTLSSTDPDLPGDTFTYSIVNDPDGKFAITGNQLRVNAPLDIETAPSHSVTVRTDDGQGGTFDQVFTITVTGLNESPVISVNTGASVGEGRSVVITAAMLNEADPDDGGVNVTYTAANLLNGHIEVNGAEQLTFTQADINLGRVRFVHDGSETIAAAFDISLMDGGEDGSVPATGTFHLTVIPDADPLLAPQSFEARETLTSGTEIGRLIFSDAEDTAGDLTLEILSGNEGGLFTLAEDGTLTLSAGKSLDYETGKTHTLLVKITDGIGQTAEASIVINVLDVAESDGSDAPRPEQAQPRPPAADRFVIPETPAEGLTEIIRSGLRNDFISGPGDIIRTGLFGTFGFGKLEEPIRHHVISENAPLLRNEPVNGTSEGRESRIAAIIQTAQSSFDEGAAYDPEIIRFLERLDTPAPQQEPEGDAETPALPIRAENLPEALERASSEFSREVEAFLNRI
jgi:hypothetical protein